MPFFFFFLTSVTARTKYPLSIGYLESSWKVALLHQLSRIYLHSQSCDETQNRHELDWHKRERDRSAPQHGRTTATIFHQHTLLPLIYRPPHHLTITVPQPPSTPPLDISTPSPQILQRESSTPHSQPQHHVPTRTSRAPPPPVEHGPYTAPRLSYT